MKRNFVVGILGGIDPESSSHFYADLIDKLKSSGVIKKNEDYPQIIINNIPAPALINPKITKKELAHYILGLKEIDQFKPDFIVMVCNTIHASYDKISKEVNSSILDLRTVVKDHLKKHKYKKIFIIGTPVTIKTGLFRSKEYTLLEPNLEEQELISKAIFNYSTNNNKEEQIEKINSLCQSYLSKGAEVVLIACTDLSMMLSGKKLNRIDTLQLLFNSTLDKILNKN
jgi:aspartate racemase